MGPLGELGALFNPGMRHEIEERQSKEMRREEAGTGRKSDLRIDLESGVVVIPVRQPARADDREADEPTASGGDDENAAIPAGAANSSSSAPAGNGAGATVRTA